MRPQVSRERSPIFKLSRERRELVHGQGAKKGFEGHFGFAQAGVEVVVERIERGPASERLAGTTGRDFTGRIREVVFDSGERFREELELVDKARAIAKENKMKNGVPGGSGLAGAASKKFAIQRLDLGNVTDVTATTGEGLAEGNKGAGKALQKAGGDGNLLAGTNEFAARAL